MSEIFSALEDNWGVPGRVSSIRALVGLVERWTKDVDNEELLERLFLSIEHFVLEELESVSFSGEGLPPRVGQSLAELTSLFESLAACLDELSEALEGRDVSEAQSLITRIRSVAQQVGDKQAALEEWMQNPEPCCLRCGGIEESQGYCPECEVELLVPNLTAAFPNVTIQLEPEFYAVYERYLAIGRGEATISSISTLLPAAENYLKEMGRAARSANRKPEDEQAREDVYRATEDVLLGLEQLRAATHSKRKVELDQAWHTIVSCLRSLKDRLSQLVATLGLQGGSDATGDQISLE